MFKQKNVLITGPNAKEYAKKLLIDKPVGDFFNTTYVGCKIFFTLLDICNVRYGSVNIDLLKNWTKDNRLIVLHCGSEDSFTKYRMLLDKETMQYDQVIMEEASSNVTSVIIYERLGLVQPEPEVHIEPTMSQLNLRTGLQALASMFFKPNPNPSIQDKLGMPKDNPMEPL